jgi:hypothetical protein
VFGVWTLNTCRIVYVVDEATRFGFAYGTLPDGCNRFPYTPILPRYILLLKELSTAV